MSNYFEFYNIPISFIPDEAQLQRTFYLNSKKYHPDFFTQDSEEKQIEILELSSLNNKAYNVLKHFDKRMKYILELKGALGEEGKNSIPQDFLMEMMDINEGLMELEFDFDLEQFQKTEAAIQELEDDLYQQVAAPIENYDDQSDTAPDSLQQIKEYYLKKRYLLRIRENLNKFAPQ